ncbi:hypothetical protein J5Y09_19705 [Roseomonas sp. PWR1]|uniref:Uncharacterized protein n=1 Tax=Roseomonas nitratireducens TaxID=2820810 RepID=A0ABS4AY01_9PROT|nr:hypothetical protein [Neoroseomonas nitratireducens]MBP0466162.1 hypothetical protein [Neoroseomonas nitratireducens]
MAKEPEARIRPEDLLRPAELRPAALKGLIAAIEKSKGKFIDWERLGKPAFDHLKVRVEVAPDRIADVVKAAMEADDLRVRFGILINGLPPLDRIPQIDLDITPNR